MYRLYRKFKFQTLIYLSLDVFLINLRSFKKKYEQNST